MRNAWRNLIRFGFRLLYNEFAFTYDLVSKAVSFGAWRCWQRSALKHLGAPPGTPILELAYGTGDLQLDLQSLGYRSFGHDLSPYMARIARRKLTRSGLTPRLTRGMAQQLPFASGVFPAVVSTFPAEFILAPETLREVHRVLQPDGRFVIVPNAVLTGRSVADSAVEWLYRVTGQRGDSVAKGDLLGFFGQYGFDAKIVQEACKRSLATVIIARKLP